MRNSTIVLLAALLVSLGTASWMWQQLRSERETNAALQVRLSQLEHHPEQHANAAPAITSPLPEERSDPRTTKVVAEAQSAPAAVGSRGDFMSRQRQLMSNPEYRKAMRDAQRQHIESVFRELPGILNLSPKEAAAVFDLMADQAIRSFELEEHRTATKDNGRILARAIDEQRRKDDAELQQLLGTSNMSRLQEFRDTIGSRVEVNTIRNELGTGPDALRDDQFDSMLGIVYSEQQRMNRELQELYATPPADGSRTYDSSRTELAVTANRRIVESARSILSGAQLTAIENLYRRQRLQMETRDTMIRLSSEVTARDARAAGGN